jgi:uncharacterized protein (TIGR00290 family)
MKRRALLSWSSGKDSAWALHLLRQDPQTEVCGLFTLVSESFERAAMHATRMELLHTQAEAVRLPLQVVKIPSPCSNDRYDEIMRGFIRESLGAGIRHMAFGDIFLEDIRHYREDRLTGTGIEPLFPLWGIPSGDLARHMMSSGLKAYVSCIDPAKVPAHIVGRAWTEELLEELPQGVDPCGEHGEFHTIAVDGPMFGFPLKVEVGETVSRDGFVFADVIPRRDEGASEGRP